MPEYKSYGGPFPARPVFSADLPAGDVELFDDLMRSAFRVTNRMPDAPEHLVDSVNEAFADHGRALLGPGLFSDVTCWLGDGPCEDGSLLEALAELYDSGEVDLDLPLRHRCARAGFLVHRLAPAPRRVDPALRSVIAAFW